MLEFVSPIRNLYGTSTAPLRNLCGTSAAPLRNLQNLCGTSTEPLWHVYYGTYYYAEPLRRLYGSPPETLHLWKLCRPLRQCVQNLCLRDLCRTSAAPLQNLSGTSIRNLRLRQHWNFQCRTSACGTFAEDLRNLCRTSAAALRNLSGTSTEPMQNLCGTSMDPRRNLCGTSTEPLQNLCCTAECVRRNLSPTSSAPPQKLCQRASFKPGTPERQHLCGTFPPPPQLLADPKPLQNLLSMELFRHSYAT